MSPRMFLSGSIESCLDFPAKIRRYLGGVHDASIGLTFIPILLFVNQGVSGMKNDQPGKIKIYDAQKHLRSGRIHKTDEEWKKLLTPEQFQVTRRKVRSALHGDILEQ